MWLPQQERGSTVPSLPDGESKVGSPCLQAFAVDSTRRAEKLHIVALSHKLILGRKCGKGLKSGDESVNRQRERSIARGPWVQEKLEGTAE